MVSRRPADTWGALLVVAPPCTDFWLSCGAGTRKLAAGREKQPQDGEKTTQGHKKACRKPKFLRRTAKKHAGQLKTRQESVVWLFYPLFVIRGFGLIF